MARLPIRCSVPARLSGTRTMRDCSASAWRIAWRIHHTAYEMNLMPFVSSNLCAARIEAEVALVDQVGERHALILILLRDRDDEAKVGAHQLVERFLVAGADVLRQPHFFIARDQRIRADIPQVLIERAFLVRRLFLDGAGHTYHGSLCSESAGRE